MSFSRQRPVYVGEDDASGLIYFVTYFHYVSEGEQLLFEELGLPVHQQVADRMAMPVVHSECNYLAPVKAGDVLTQSITLTLGNRASLVCDHEFFNSDGTRVATARLVRVMTDLDSLTSVEIPSSVRKLLDVERLVPAGS